MLARNFMSATDLGLTEEEHGALVKVLGMFERGEIPDGEFSMKTFQHACGTPSCICGWAHYASGGKAFASIINGGDRLSYQLFTPGTSELFGIDGMPYVRNATTSQAAKALNSYLTTGWPSWDVPTGR